MTVTIQIPAFSCNNNLTLEQILCHVARKHGEMFVGHPETVVTVQVPSVGQVRCTVLGE